LTDKSPTEFKINLEDIPSIFQLTIAQEAQQETIEQLILEVKATNDRVEKLANICFEQAKLIQKLKESSINENSRD
jgi:hypothetical protein